MLVCLFVIISLGLQNCEYSGCQGSVLDDRLDSSALVDLTTPIIIICSSSTDQLGAPVSGDLTGCVLYPIRISQTNGYFLKGNINQAKPSDKVV